MEDNKKTSTDIDLDMLSEMSWEFKKLFYNWKNMRRDHIAPELKKRVSFTSKRDAQRKKGRGRNNFCAPRLRRYRNSPIDLLVQTIVDSEPISAMVTPSQFKPLPIAGSPVSVFILSLFSGEPVKMMIQKVKKKSVKGLPGGTIQDGELILDAAEREYAEETGKGLGGGISITKYHPIVLGEFELADAINKEKGIAVLVELPKSELENVKIGKTDVDEEISHVWLATLNQMEVLIKKGDFTRNSQMAYELFKKLVGQYL